MINWFFLLRNREKVYNDFGKESMGRVAARRLKEAMRISGIKMETEFYSNSR